MINRPEHALVNRAAGAVEPIAVAGGGASAEQMPSALAQLLMDATRHLAESLGLNNHVQVVIDTMVTGDSRLEARIEIRLSGSSIPDVTTAPRIPVVVDLVHSAVDVAGHCVPMAPRDIAVLAFILHARQTGEDCAVRDRLQSEATGRHRTRADLKIIEMAPDRCTKRAYRRVAFFRLAAGLRRLNEGFPIHWFGNFDAEVDQLADELLTKDLAQALARVRRQLQDAFGKSAASRIVSFGRESFTSPLPAADIRIIVPTDLAAHPELPAGVVYANDEEYARLLRPQA